MIIFSWLLWALLANAVVADEKCDYSKINIADECPSEVLDWEEIGNELYKAKSLVFLGNIDGALGYVFQVLQAVSQPFARGFECPMAMSSIYFTMGHLFAIKRAFRRALAFMQMGFIFVRDKGFNECTPWPVQGWEMLLGGKNLVEKVQTLDRPGWNEVPPHFRYNGMKIAIVTICAYAEDEVVRVMSTENHQLYAALHNYDFRLFTSTDQILPARGGKTNVTDGVHKPFFWKVNAVRNVMMGDNPPDWVLWLDCDAFFMNATRTLDSVIEKYTGNTTFPFVANDAVTLPDELKQMGPVNLILAVDSTGINNGVWFLRNTDWSINFLDRWWDSKILDGPGKNHNCSDQSTMQHELLFDRTFAMDTGWDLIEGPIWPPEVRIAQQQDLQSFHQATAMTVLSREWQPGDFIRHHPGCHYYKEPCKHMFVEAQQILVDQVQELMAEQKKQRALEELTATQSRMKG